MHFYFCYIIVISHIIVPDNLSRVEIGTLNTFKGLLVQILVVDSRHIFRFENVHYSTSTTDPNEYEYGTSTFLISVRALLLVGFLRSQFIYDRSYVIPVI
jgi:hypothetical protein